MNDNHAAVEAALDQMISRFFRHLREDGYSLAEIQTAVSRSLSAERPDHFLVLEPDPELRGNARAGQAPLRYNLDYYVSHFDRLAIRAEIDLRKSLR